MLRLLDLPRDLLLHLLLHHFTLQEVIPLRSLSHELYDLVHYCLARRRSLKLFFSFTELQAYTNLLYEHNLESDCVLRLHSPGPFSDELILHYHSFHNPVVDLLVDELFPNVTHLIIFYHDHIFRGSTPDENVRQVHLLQKNVPYLISRLCTRLTGLSLFGHARGDTIGHCSARRLVHSINKCQGLRRLDLCVKQLHLCSNNEYHAELDDDDDDDDDDEIVQPVPAQPFLVIDPKLLNKLERMSILFDEGHGPRFCKQSLPHLGPNLTQLVMYQLFASERNYVAEPLLCHLLIGRANGTTLVPSSITYLSLTQHLSTLLPKVLPQFSGLKSLDLVQFTFSKTENVMTCLELFALLAQFCPQLTELKLAKFTIGWVRQVEQLNDLPQLECISNLVLKCVHQRHHHDPDVKPEDENIPFDKFLSTFAFILPNLEVLNLKTVSGYFSFTDGDSIIQTGRMQPRMRSLSIGYYPGTKFTCHHLLSAQYRTKYIRECAEGWIEQEKRWVKYSRDLEEGIWKKEQF